MKVSNLIIVGCLLALPMSLYAHQASTPTMSMQSFALSKERMDIYIRPDKVRITTVYYNTSALEQIETLVFPVTTPQFDKLDDHHQERIENYQVYVDGRKVDLQSKVYPVSYRGEDISGILASLNLPYEPLQAMQHFKQGQPNFSHISATLQGHDLIDTSHHRAKWLAKKFYYWQQRFPIAEEVQIQQIFKPELITRTSRMTEPRPKRKLLPISIWDKIKRKDGHDEHEERDNSNEVYSSNELKTFQRSHQEFDEYIQQFCPSDADYLALLEYYYQKGVGEPRIITRELRLTLNSDYNWAGPINHFTLRVDNPEHTRAMMCWPYPFNDLQYNSHVSQAQNFIPLQDIRILFIEHLNHAPAKTVLSMPDGKTIVETSVNSMPAKKPGEMSQTVISKDEFLYDEPQVFYKKDLQGKSKKKRTPPPRMAKDKRIQDINELFPTQELEEISWPEDE